MLADIVARYLGMTSENAKALITLIDLEGHWQKQQAWKGKRYALSNVKTQADFITFLQIVAQSHWANNDDDIPSLFRPEFNGDDGRAASKESMRLAQSAFGMIYFYAFETTGFVRPICYDTTLETKPIRILLYASQPRALRFAKTIQKELGPDYKVNVVGTEFTAEKFHLYPETNITFFLREIAWLINSNYTAENSEHYRAPLTEEERREIRTLGIPMLEREKRIHSDDALSGNMARIELADNQNTVFGASAAEARAQASQGQPSTLSTPTHPSLRSRTIRLRRVGADQ